MVTLNSGIRCGIIPKVECRRTPFSLPGDILNRFHPSRRESRGKSGIRSGVAWSCLNQASLFCDDRRVRQPSFAHVIGDTIEAFREYAFSCRGTFLVLLLIIGAWFSGGSEACGQTAQGRSFESRAQEYVTPETQKAIDRGLAYLSNRQQPDGSYLANNYKRNVAITALSGMAFLSAGSVPGRGPYGKNVDRSIEYVLACSSPSGFIKRDDSPEHGPMYGHGFATLFLAEVYGMTPRPEVHDALKRATQLIVNSQNKEGGWRYKPDGREADVSVTVCQMMALRAARNCGIAVPKTTVDNCVEYVRKCQNADGGFRYQLVGRPMSDFPRSAAGVVVLYNAGITEGRDIERGLAYLMRSPPRGDLIHHDPHYFYGQYYAVQAMWHAGEDYWRQWYPAIRDELTLRQLPDGGWSDSTINDAYGTAMACLILQMPNNLLPIFQR